MFSTTQQMVCGLSVQKSILQQRFDLGWSLTVLVPSPCVYKLPAFPHLPLLPAVSSAPHLHFHCMNERSTKVSDVAKLSGQFSHHKCSICQPRTWPQHPKNIWSMLLVPWELQEQPLQGMPIPEPGKAATGSESCLWCSYEGNKEWK